MSARQFGFLIGFLFVALISVASLWVALVALVAGVIGYLVVRALEGDLELSDLTERLGAGRRYAGTLGRRDSPPERRV